MSNSSAVVHASRVATSQTEKPRYFQRGFLLDFDFNADNVEAQIRVKSDFDCSPFRWPYSGAQFMISAKLQSLALWLLGTGAISYIVLMLTFAGTGFPAWLVTLTTLIVYYGVAAIPLGLLLIVVAQVMKLFKL